MRLLKSRVGIIKLMIVLAVTFSFTLMVFIPFTSIRLVSAGVISDVLADNTLFSGSSINSTNWRYRADEGINIITREANGQKAVLFGGTTYQGGSIYTMGHPLINRKSAHVGTETDFLEINFHIRLVRLEDGMRFGFIFGIPKLSGDVGDSDSYFLYFLNGGSEYKVGLSYFDKGGVEQQLFDHQALASEIKAGGFAAEDFSVDILANGTGYLEIMVEGQTIYLNTLKNNDGAAMDFSGYIGFSLIDEKLGSDSNVNVEIGAPLYVYNSFYTRPSTPLVITENFDDGGYDINLWQFRNPWLSKTGCYVYDGKFIFDRAYSGSYLMTSYKYSNFELSFSLSDIQNNVIENIYAYGGKQAATKGFAVTFGHSSNKSGLLYGKIIPSHVYNDFNNLGYQVVFDASVNSQGERSQGTSISIYKQSVIYKQEIISSATDSSLENYDFFNWTDNREADNEIQINITMTNGIVKVGLKTASEQSYTTACEYEFSDGFAPIGQVGFWALGASAGNSGGNYDRYSCFAIDDITIKNADILVSDVEIGTRVTNKMDISGVEYISPWDDNDLLSMRISTINTSGDKAEKTLKAILISGASVLIVGVSATIGIIYKSRKKRGA